MDTSTETKKVIENVLSRNPRTINNKREVYALYENGLFGNKAKTWDSYEKIVEDGWTGLVCMRSKRGMDRVSVVYNIPLEEVPKNIKSWLEKGFRYTEISFNQNMPDKCLLVQGEVMRSEGGLCLRYTTIKKPMNLSLLEEDLKATGLRAKIILEKNLDPSSYSDMEALLESFPNSIIEFSTYSINVGCIPGRNTVFWEVRNF